MVEGTHPLLCSIRRDRHLKFTKVIGACSSATDVRSEEISLDGSIKRAREY